MLYDAGGINLKTDIHRDILKETGTRDCYRLKDILFDSSWFGESPVAVHNFVNCAFNFILNTKLLAV
jgi:hypothetical protein